MKTSFSSGSASQSHLQIATCLIIPSMHVHFYHEHWLALIIGVTVVTMYAHVLLCPLNGSNWNATVVTMHTCDKTAILLFKEKFRKYHWCRNCICDTSLLFILFPFQSHRATVNVDYITAKKRSKLRKHWHSILFPLLLALSYWWLSQLYVILMLASFLVPFALTFHKKDQLNIRTANCYKDYIITIIIS